MIKQLGIPIDFAVLSCADLRWEEVPYIIIKLKILEFSDKQLRNLSYQEWCNLLNNKPVFATRSFQYKVEVFFKEFILDGPLAKTKHCAMWIEFQEKDKAHVHSFIWIFIAPNIKNEVTFIEFTEKTIFAQLLDHLNDP